MAVPESRESFVPYMVQSTDQAPPGERLVYWHEAVCRSVLSVSVAPDKAVGRDFTGHIAARRTQGGGFALFRSSAHVIRRTRRQAAALEDDAVLVSAQIAGEAWIESDSGRTRLIPGDFGIVDGRQAFEIHFPRPVERILAVLPRQAVLDSVPGLVDTGASKLMLQPSIATLLRETLHTLFAPDVPTDDGFTSRLTENVCNLLSCASACEASAAGRSASLQQERRRSAVLRLIAERFRDPAFGPGVAARYLGVSTRSVHKALEGTGRTFGDLLREARLEACHSELCAREPELGIAELALACGFSDISHFNHVFRKHFGMSPGQVRSSRASSPI
jgi:AraC family transcriptional activator of tynA and feaB